jgi:hypothetical protein
MAFRSGCLAGAVARPAATWIVALALGVGGCAAPGTESGQGPASDKERIASRAQQRWDALVEGRVETAYSYLSPGSREVMTLREYNGSIRLGFWKKAVVKRVECPEQDLCDVQVTVDYVVRGTPVSSPVVEKWTRSGGEWWFVVK